MYTRLFVPVILASTMFGAPAMAASHDHAIARDPFAGPMASTGPVAMDTIMTAPERCAALESQYKSVIKSHKSEAKMTNARTLRSEGIQLCEDRNHMEGIAKLQQALRELGVTPIS